MPNQNATTLESRLRRLAERPFPKHAISQDPQTSWYGDRNQDFLSRCDVDLDLSKLAGLGKFVFHLTGEAYGVLIARTLLKYVTIVSRSKPAVSEELYNQELSTFLAFFSVDSSTNTVQVALQTFDRSEQVTLLDSAKLVIKKEQELFEREISFLDELEDFIAWLDTKTG